MKLHILILICNIFAASVIYVQFPAHSSSAHCVHMCTSRFSGWKKIFACFSLFKDTQLQTLAFLLI